MLDGWHINVDSYFMVMQWAIHSEYEMWKDSGYTENILFFWIWILEFDQ